MNLWRRVRDRADHEIVRRIRARRERALDDRLRPGPDEFEPTLEIPRNRVNGPEVIEFLRRQCPDLLVVSGAPILRSRVFDLAPLGSINVHLGIAPAYRGQDTLFWAVRRRDWDGVGVTLHRIDSGVDTGRVLAYGYPELYPDDDEVSIAGKCAHLAAELLGELLQAAARGPLAGTAQRDEGRTYRASERSIGAEIAAVLVRLRHGGPPPRPKRIERFFD